jgi:alpha-amylase
MGDDGEKFGLWPSTHTHCWENGWMDEFFTALEANSDWLIMTPPGEYITHYPALGRIYLPNASYDEMTEWALPPQQSAEMIALKRRLQDEHRDDILRYLKGGLWRSFMSKYPEVNSMHKKMLLVSEKVHRIKSRKQRAGALDALWAGQCNCLTVWRVRRRVPVHSAKRFEPHRRRSDGGRERMAMARGSRRSRPTWTRMAATK